MFDVSVNRYHLGNPWPVHAQMAWNKWFRKSEVSLDTGPWSGGTFHFRQQAFAWFYKCHWFKWQILLNFGFIDAMGWSLNRSRILKFEKITDPDPDEKIVEQEYVVVWKYDSCHLWPALDMVAKASASVLVSLEFDSRPGLFKNFWFITVAFLPSPRCVEELQGLSRTPNKFKW